MKMRNSGFTLVELMITLAVGIIVLSIGVPAFTNMMAGNQATGTANELIAALRLTRSEAVKRGTEVTICASNVANTTCSGDDWHNGWIIYVDDNDDGTFGAADDTLIRVWQSPEGGATFNAATPNSIRYLASGELSTSVNDFAFRLSHCQGNQSKVISITLTGRPSVTNTACF
ncbi:MAG: GspH/FimT family pseudopilin [Candidatus Thiodiazotropha sp. (ex Monitilora ramsayi)]|nr:GspH/FimT family pseudopilin [Candidatus Thiodiazotropha sp. (ex Monitilora ramsayi)]